VRGNTSPQLLVDNAQMRRSVAILGLIFTISVFGISGAFAHAQVEGMNPKKGAVLNSSPKTVWIEFGEKLLVLDKNHINSLTVSDSSGKRIDKAPAVINGTRATAKLKGVLSAGKYVVNYRVVSEDGHEVKGSYYFSVK